MPRIFNVHMTQRQYEIVSQMIPLLVLRLSYEGNQITITYRDLANQLGTNFRKLGIPLLIVSDVIHQCPVCQPVPSLNALVVYSSSHLPSVDGLQTAEPDLNINNANLNGIMHEMNNAAQNFQDWDAVLRSIEENSFND